MTYQVDTSAEGKDYYYVVATNTVGNTVSMATSTVTEVTVIPAGKWVQNENGWQYQNNDGSYASITWQNIIWKSRVPQALTALVAGAGLSVSGLQMQTVFRNPLAGPSVLGISSGASLGVACVVLLSGAMGGVALSRLGYMGEVALSVAAIIGALAVMALIVYVSQKVKGNVTLLIIGVMIGYVASAVIGVLKYFSVEEDIRAYVIWGLGSFARVSGDQMVLFVCIMAVLLPLSFLLIKTMNL